MSQLGELELSPVHTGRRYGSTAAPGETLAGVALSRPTCREAP
ncbi:MULTISPECIES: hypothetical protein [unclassified Streptomyces]